MLGVPKCIKWIFFSSSLLMLLLLLGVSLRNLGEQNASKPGDLKICVSTTSAYLLKELKGYYEEQEGVSIEVVVTSSEQAVEQVLNRQVDLALIARPLKPHEVARGLAQYTVVRDGIFLVVQESKLAKSKGFIDFALGTDGQNIVKIYITR